MAADTLLFNPFLDNQKGELCLAEFNPLAENFSAWIEGKDLSCLCCDAESQYFEPVESFNKSSRNSVKLVESADSKLGWSRHLLFACIHGKPETVGLVLSHSNATPPSQIDLNAPLPCDNGQGLTPLCVAIVSGRVSVCELLIKAGADVNKADGQSRYPLHWAASADHQGMVKILLRNGAKLDCTDSQGLSPLHYGCYKGRAPMVAALLTESSTAGESPKGVTPLIMACLRGHTQVVKLLMKRSPSSCLIAADEQGLTPFHYAVWSRNMKCMKVLTGHSTWKIGLKQGDIWGRTLLITAAARGDAAVCQFLLKKGARLNEVDKDGRSVLHWAVLSGQLVCVEFFLKSREGRDLCRCRDSKGVSPLHLAVLKRQKELVEAILEKGPAPHLVCMVTAVDRQGALVWAAACGWLEGVQLLLEVHGALSGLQEGTREALHAAASVGAVDVCQVLLVAGFDVDGRCSKELTPLHHASQHGHLRCVRELLLHGAKVDTLTSRQESSLHLAVVQGHSDIARELLENKADRKKPVGAEQNCPSHLACVYGHVEVLQQLISAGIDLNKGRGRDGHTPLFIAAAGGFVDCCMVLVEHGADVRLRMKSTPEGLTALDVAMKNTHTECANHLVSCHAPSGGGVYHRAALTIQAVWKYHRHKYYKRVTYQWAAMTLQRSIRAWLCRLRARRVSKARNAAFHKAASLIQCKWRSYISKKRHYEATYARLKARLKQEKLAASLIVAELHAHAQSVSLLPDFHVGTSVTKKRQSLAMRRNCKLHLLKTSITSLSKSILVVPRPQPHRTPQSIVKLQARKAINSLKTRSRIKQSEEKLSKSVQHTISLPPIHDLAPNAQPSSIRTSKRISCNCKVNHGEDDSTCVVKLPAIPDTNCLLLNSSKIGGGVFDHHPGISGSGDGDIFQLPLSFKSLPYLENSFASSSSLNMISSEDGDIVRHSSFFKLPHIENSVSSSSFNITCSDDGDTVRQPSFFKTLHHPQNSVSSSPSLSFKIPSLSHLKHTSTFKDTLLGYQPYISRKAGGKGNTVRKSVFFRTLPHQKKSVTSSPSFKMPSLSHLKLLHHTSTFKDTPLGYRPYISRKAAGNEGMDLQIVENAEGIIEDEQARNPVDISNSLQLSASSDNKLHGHRKSRRESDCGSKSDTSCHLINHFEEKLSPKHKADVESRRSMVLNKVERFERLMKVLSLLKQFKALEEIEVGMGVCVSGRSSGGGGGGLGAIRDHIKSALDEAIRLRMETDPRDY